MMDTFTEHTRVELTADGYVALTVELDRHEDLVHGGYDTLDLGIESVAGLVAALRAVAA